MKMWPRLPSVSSILSTAIKIHSWGDKRYLKNDLPTIIRLINDQKTHSCFYFSEIFHWGINQCSCGLWRRFQLTCLFPVFSLWCLIVHRSMGAHNHFTMIIGLFTTLASALISWLFQALARDLVFVFLFFPRSISFRLLPFSLHHIRWAGTLFTGLLPSPNEWGR